MRTQRKLGKDIQPGDTILTPVDVGIGDIPVLVRADTIVKIIKDDSDGLVAELIYEFSNGPQTGYAVYDKYRHYTHL